MEHKDNWKHEAKDLQNFYFETLGSREYDEIKKNDLFRLRKTVGFGLCGEPKSLPSSTNFYTGYNKEELEAITAVCNQIITKSDSYSDEIKLSYTNLILHHKTSLCKICVFRVITSCGTVFIDANTRVYQSWIDFIKRNKLPKCEYCYPLNGVYSGSKGLCGFARSPASRFMNKAIDCLDTVGTVAALGAAGVAAASVFVAAAPAVLATATVAGISTGAYSVTRSGYTLVDRKKHGQSVGLKDAEARAAWVNLATSAVGAATAGALVKAKKVVDSGKSLSKIGVVGIRALNGTSLLFSGFGFVDTAVTCYDKYSKGMLEKKDVFNLSCELLFLFNAIYSAKVTNDLFNKSVAINEGTVSKKKLTKTQKRNLQKRNAKKRAKGLTVTRNLDDSKESIRPLDVCITVSPLVLQYISTAAKHIDPRLQEITFDLHSMGHDIMRWVKKEITIKEMFDLVYPRIEKMYGNYKKEIREMLRYLGNFCCHVVSKVKNILRRLFMSASHEQQMDFSVRVINMEDELNTLVKSAEVEVEELHNEKGEGNELQDKEGEVNELQDKEGEAQELQNKVGIKYTSDSEDSECLEEESCMDDYSQTVLMGSVKLVEQGLLSCNDLEELSDILEGMKYVIVGEFKKKLSDYKQKYELVKSISKEYFNLNDFHGQLGIGDDVVQHLFEEILQEVTAKDIVYRVKSKVRDIKREKVPGIAPMWEAVASNVFQYLGIHGKGQLTKHDLLSVVGKILKMNLAEHVNCTVVESETKGVVMIETQASDGTMTQVLVFKSKLEYEETAHLMIIVNEEEKNSEQNASGTSERSGIS